MLWPGWIRHFNIQSLYTACPQGHITPVRVSEQLQILKFQTGERYNREFLRCVHGKEPYFKYNQSERRVLYRWFTEKSVTVRAVK